MLKHTHMNIYHAQMQSSFRHSGNTIHLSQHSFIRFIIFINRIYSCRSKNGQDHLSYESSTPQPATSLQRSSPCLRPTRRTRLQASNSRAKFPMNIWIQKIAKTKCLNIHTWTFIHLTCSSFSLTENKVAEMKWTRELILWNLLPQPATSLQRSTQP